MNPATDTATPLRNTYGLGMPITANRQVADIATVNLQSVTCNAEE
jgi:hypothetical protein